MLLLQWLIFSFVRSPIRPELLERTNHQNFLKFCMNVYFHSTRRIVFLNFLKKTPIASPGDQKGSKYSDMAKNDTFCLITFIRPLDFSETFQNLKIIDMNIKSLLLTLA